MAREGEEGEKSAVTIKLSTMERLPLVALPLGAQDQRLDAEPDQLRRGSTGTASGHCQETETCMVRARHTPRLPLQNHPSGHLGGWAPSWSAEEMLDGQHQRVDTSAHARVADEGLLQKTGRGSVLN